MHDDRGFDASTPPGGDALPPARRNLLLAAAVAGGLVLGGVFGWVARPAERVEVPVPRELTADEVVTACAPQVETTVGELAQAQERITVLEKEVAERKARVEELEKKRSVAGAALAGQLEEAKKDLATARDDLATARREKDDLVVQLSATSDELGKTKEALTAQAEQTQRAKEDALVNKWYRFVNDAQLDICDKGTRKKVGDCREVVSSALRTEGRRDQFAHCVRSGQAVPAVRELDKDAAPPSYAEPVVAAERDMRDWVVLFCDPSLPERPDGFLGESHLPPTTLTQVRPIQGT